MLKLLCIWSCVLSGQAQDEVDRLIREQNEEDDRPKVLIERSVFTQKMFDESFEAGMRPRPSVTRMVKKKAHKCECSPECVKKSIFSFLPFINIMKAYNIKEDLMGDVISGLTVGIMHIPQGKTNTTHTVHVIS